MPDASAHRCPTTPGSGGPRTLAGAVPGCFDQHMSNDALTLIREESDRLATVLTATDPDRHVPSCPAWTAADLLWHLTEVHEFWGAILATGALTDEQAGSVEEQIAPRPEDVAQLCERRAAATDLLLGQDRKSTRLNSSHVANSYAVFCVKQKTNGLAGLRGADRDAGPWGGGMATRTTDVVPGGEH